MTRALDYEPPGPTTRLRRQVAFWRVWSLVATSLLVFASFVLLSTGPRLWWLGCRELLRRWVGAS